MSRRSEKARARYREEVLEAGRAARAKLLEDAPARAEHLLKRVYDHCDPGLRILMEIEEIKGASALDILNEMFKQPDSRMRLKLAFQEASDLGNVPRGNLQEQMIGELIRTRSPETSFAVDLLLVLTACRFLPDPLDDNAFNDMRRFSNLLKDFESPLESTIEGAISTIGIPRSTLTNVRSTLGDIGF